MPEKDACVSAERRLSFCRKTPVFLPEDARVSAGRRASFPAVAAEGGFAPARKPGRTSGCCHPDKRGAGDGGLETAAVQCLFPIYLMTTKKHVRCYFFYGKSMFVREKLLLLR